MRHRMIAEHTGLGNPSKQLMNNTGDVPRELLLRAIELYFSEWGGCDYEVLEGGILIGIEPSYQFERLKVIFIGNDKKHSYIETGKAWGAWGSEIVRTTKYYKNYKYKSKFIKFIDEASKLLTN